MNEGCGCCEGVEALTPLDLTSRPGLPALRYRVGTWWSFFETMKARLSSSDLGPLSRLGTRDLSDFSIALLDAWAAVCDVLTFYTERIANEGYLRTATERRSVLELARLVGYTLRPGLAASTYLAYTLEKGSNVTIPTGSKAQSVPDQGQLPQTFETSADLDARTDWNNLAPRAVRPHFVRPDSSTLYLQGQTPNIKPNDLLLIIRSDQPSPVRVTKVEQQASQNRTKVTVQDALPNPTANRTTTVGSVQPGLSTIGTTSAGSVSTDLSNVGGSAAKDLFDTITGLLDPLLKPPADHPANAAYLPQSIYTSFQADRDAIPRLLTAGRPELRAALYAGLANAGVTDAKPPEVYAFRVQTAPFGNNAPLEAVPRPNSMLPDHREWKLQRIQQGPPVNYVFRVGVQRQATGSVSVVAVVAAPPSWLLNLTVLRNGSAYVSLEAQKIVSGTAFTANATDGTMTGTLTEKTAALGFAFELELVFPSSITLAFIVDANGSRVVGSGVNVASVSSGGPQQNVFNFEVVGEKDSTTVGGVTEDPNKISLDAHYENIIPGSWALVQQNKGGQVPQFIAGTVTAVADRSRADYGISAKSTELTIQLSQPWIDPAQDDLSIIRGTTVYAGAEPLQLADEPMPIAIAGSRIELDSLYDGLTPGRWLVVAGERTDIPNTAGVQGVELVMLAGVEQSIQKVDPLTGLPVNPDIPNLRGSAPQDLPKDTLHTFLVLASPLQYTYKADTVTIYGNVVPATHGETRAEVLGSGDGRVPSQQMQLRQPPLTFVAAATPVGGESTLQLRVNDVLWHETDTFVGAGASDRDYTLRINDDGKTFVTFGNGTEGARLPTGTENVKAVYRTGIGAGGNLSAGQISLLASRPLGVKGVINPLPSTGGANREDSGSAKRNVPVAVMALDRLVSVRDYSDFARTFAGIAKAAAIRMASGQRQIVHVTIAGAAGMTIDLNSDLYRNLIGALLAYGDPHQEIELAPCELLLLVISARVCVLPDYQWDFVKPKVSAALLDAFGFDRSDLGQDVLLTDALTAIQSVEGVSYAIIDILTTISRRSAEALGAGIRRLLNSPAAPPRIRIEVARPDADGSILPAQIAVLSPDTPQTLVLTEIKS